MLTRILGSLEAIFTQHIFVNSPSHNIVSAPPTPTHHHDQAHDNGLRHQPHQKVVQEARPQDTTTVSMTLPLFDRSLLTDDDTDNHSSSSNSSSKHRRRLRHHSPHSRSTSPPSDNSSSTSWTRRWPVSSLGSASTTWLCAPSAYDQIPPLC